MNSDDLDDADYRAAIAASMADYQGSEPEQVNNPQTSQVVDLTGDSDSDDVVPIFPKSNSVIGSDTDDEEDEDEDMKRAIALSLQEARRSSNDRSVSPLLVDSERNKSQDPTSPSTREVKTKADDHKPLGILGLDRKQMEQERLARLAKRKAEDPVHSDYRETKQSRIDLASTPRVSELGTRTGNMSSSSDSQAGSSVETSSTSSSLQYPDGVVKKTWALGCSRQGDDIKIEEVFQKSDLELAVLSSFLWNPDWVFSKLDTRNTRFVLMIPAKDDATKREWESDTAGIPNIRVCFPPMDGNVSCMHSKLMLLFHPGYLRIVVPSANLMPFDWGEMNGVMENSVFLIDLPKTSSTASGKRPSTDFYNELVYFLRASTLHEDVIFKLDSFDFSKTSKYAFVHTIGGSHTGNAWKRTGYCGLGHAVSSLGLSTSKPVNLDFVRAKTSSIGSLNSEFLRSLYLASQGDIGMTDFALRYSKTFPAKLNNSPPVFIPKDLASESKDRFRIYFPSQGTVTSSKGGPRCAGTVCFQSKWYLGDKFPRQALRDCESRRTGLLMHNKILYVRPDTPIRLSDTTQCRAWAYVGSANLSESAWGRLSQDRTTRGPKLNCRNWECGVIVPVIEKTTPAQKDENAEQDAAASSPSLSGETTASSSSASASASSPDQDDGSALSTLFGGTVPVPMYVPGSRYRGSRTPWYFSEAMS
ncbi:phospholipase D/nuclease [Aspergillus ellipticus CBS 707.79]|uniref:Phospholipase D/nuclease n=1 Tax=Aspergillus ellipticus CBS 707.79 TaxID=1448320 RepID=A0A319DRK3_9EURO|nr:phospholipase D/nuclease [Aspergillus ellipticus CBS 707.79]